MKNNPSGKIRTSHLKAKSVLSMANQSGNQPENHQIKLSMRRFRKMKSELWRFRQQSTIEVNMPSMIEESEIFALHETKVDPNKLSELVSYFGSRKDTDFYKKLKIENNKNRLQFFIKDKPEYQQAAQKYKSLYWVWKVWGLKLWKWSKEQEILPYSSLVDKTCHNKSMIEKIPSDSVIFC